MAPFATHVGSVLSLDRANVDTDAIIPKQFMKSLRRSGFGDNLFDEWRYLDHGEPGQDCSTRPLNQSFVLNDPRYADASILLTRANFGCGSSREHAAWAVRDYGIKVLIAPSFADIFYTNCLNVGLLPIALDEGLVDGLFAASALEFPYRLRVDLLEQSIETPDGTVLRFAIDARSRRYLLEGLDPIALTLQHAAQIAAYERDRRALEPWLFDRHLR